MSGDRGRDTAPEVALRSALHRRELRFRKRSRPIPDLRSTPGVVFTGWRAKHDRNVARDHRDDAALPKTQKTS